MVYSGLDQKSVTRWLDLRNKASHGKHSEYTKEQVALTLQGVRLRSPFAGVTTRRADTRKAFPNPSFSGLR